MKRHAARLVDTKAVGLEMKGGDGGAGQAVDAVAVEQDGVAATLVIALQRGAEYERVDALTRSSGRAVHSRRHFV